MTNTGFTRYFGLFVFLLASLYGFADYFIVFAKNDFIDEWKGPFIQSIKFVFSFIMLLTKILLALLFLFTLTVVFVFAIVGIFKPWTKKDITSNDAIRTASSAVELMTNTENEYTAIFKMVIEKVSKLVFGVIDITQAMLLLFIVIPVFMFIAVFIYNWSNLPNKKGKELEEVSQRNLLLTNFHFMNIFVFSIMTIYALHLIYLVLPGVL